MVRAPNLGVWLEGICPGKFSDLSGKIFRFVWKNFQICPEKFSDLSGKIFRFVWENFQICPEKFSDLSLFSVFKINLFI